jgi:hypothetical protein
MAPDAEEGKEKDGRKRYEVWALKKREKTMRKHGQERWSL